ncbi:hypothetical protein ACHAAC_15670 [Aeromicrobium sp. CF4.19]|uniref:hypothetical protein n=1 Tax=Aeromicrobium sp. CF4.19 TaxID=3373082 RepID=UPI003EE4ABA9
MASSDLKVIVLQQDDEVVTWSQLLETFLDVPLPETSAILVVLAASSPDDLMRKRARCTVVPGPRSCRPGVDGSLRTSPEGL